MKHIAYILTALFIIAYSVNAQSQKENTPPSTKKMIVHVDGMACPFCAFSVEKKLERIKGVESLEIKINEGRVVLLLKPDASVDSTVVKQKITEAGFTPRKVEFLSEVAK